ncbi:MAG TPA: hypothetical protein VMV46_05790 [Thermoanaerobaculia bacterium]|nr:hypothetical protein [Thermoanaerobaculia bacterium]
MSARLLPLALLVVALAAPARADFKTSFREGVKAYDSKSWSEVVRYMQEALTDRPHAERTQVPIFSTRFISYIPNTFLGIALYQLDRCEEAIPYFENAEAQGIAPARERSYYSEMVEARRVCVDRLMTQALATAEAAMRTATAMESSLETMSREPDTAALLRQAPELKTQLDRGMSLMQGAKERVEAGAQARNFAIVREAAEYAKRAETELAAAKRDIEARRSAGADQAIRAAQQALAAARSARQELDRYKAEADVRAIWDRDLAALESEAEDLLRRAEEGLASAGVDAGALRSVRERADQARAKLEQAQSQGRERVAQERRRRESADQIAAGARAAVAGAQRALEALDRWRGTAELRDAWASGGRLGARERELRDTLERAREELAGGSRSQDAEQLGRATDLANRASAGFAALSREAETLLADARATGPDTGPTTSIEVSPPGDPEVAPPAALRNAVAAYFDGDYQATLRLLPDEAFASEPRARAQACLFRAAARFALWQLGGRQDETLRQAVSRDIDAGKAADPALRAEARFFPPPFVDLVRDGE